MNGWLVVIAILLSFGVGILIMIDDRLKRIADALEKKGEAKREEQHDGC